MNILGWNNQFLTIVLALISLVSAIVGILSFLETHRHPKIKQRPATVLIIVFSCIFILSLFLTSLVFFLGRASTPEPSPAGNTQTPTPTTLASPTAPSQPTTPTPSQSALTTVPISSATPTYKNYISVNCTSEPDQLCSPPYSTTVDTKRFLKIEYINRNCSSIRLFIFVDNKKIKTTQWLGWTHTAIFASPPQLPPTTGIIDLGSVTSGQHALALQAQGMISGCNEGSIASWTGTVSIYT